MLVLNLGATCGCLVGLILGWIISGPYVLIPFFLAFLIYNSPTDNHKPKAKI